MSVKRRNKVSAEFSMSSLTDIIFLLLIFFMLTSTLVSPNALKLKLPTSSSKATEPTTIPVSITPNDKWYVNAKEISKNSLYEVLRKERNAAKKKGDNPSVMIVAAQGVPIESVVKVMDASMRLKMGAILATDPN